MAYTPKQWVCGETITAKDLNHLENGVADCCGGEGTVNIDEPIVIGNLSETSIYASYGGV